MQDIALLRQEAEKQLRAMSRKEYSAFAKEAFAKGYTLAEFPSFYLKKHETIK